MRDALGQWLPGSTGNEKGRLPRQHETKYLEVTMATVTVEKWAKVVSRALEDALESTNPHVRARAREWLAKYLIGEPSQLHQIMFQEERKFEILVRFEGDAPRLPDDVVDGEIIEQKALLEPEEA